ncbi:MAG: LolA family protein [Solirubrobacterales bacterium]
MKPERKVEERVRELRESAGAETHARILGHLLTVQKEHKQQSPAAQRPEFRRTLMKSSIAKLAAAAVVLVAAALSIPLLVKSTATASAAEIFYQAAAAMDGLTSFHIKVQMRTPPNDNFNNIGLDRDFTTIDFWKQATDDEWGKWRLEEPGRIVVMDGQTSTMLMKNSNTVHEVEDRSPERYWTECLVEVDKVMAREAQNASERPAEFTSYRETGTDGREMIVVSVEMKSKVPPTDHLRNKYIEDSDHLKTYRFNAETKLLEDLEIYVHDVGRDVLVFQLLEAQYNTELDPGLFSLELPADVIRTAAVEVLPDNAKYEQMTPKEAATAFFTACAQENWDELLKYLGQTGVPQMMKDYLGKLEIISIGEPFQSADYAGWFVPYEIKLNTGYVKKHNLALRNDNPAKRFQLDGGI